MAAAPDEAKAAGGGGGGVALLIIDPQNDFHPGGSLAVAGADEDTERTCKLIAEKGDAIGKVCVTLDSHQRCHIAHALFWVDADGNQPPPFTIITSEDLASGKWAPAKAEHKDHAAAYVKKLEDQAKYALCIWPYHCIMGTAGHNIKEPLNVALAGWADKHGAPVDYVFKGQNTLTEMYSALKAEVVMPDDPCKKKATMEGRRRAHAFGLWWTKPLVHCCALHRAADHFLPPPFGLFLVYPMSSSLSLFPSISLAFALQRQP